MGDLEVSYNDKYLAYSLDLKGSEYFTIYLRDISSKELISEKIKDTSGSISFSLDDKYVFTQSSMSFIGQKNFQT